MNKNEYKEKDETTNILEMIFEFLRYWKWILLSLLIFSAFGLAKVLSLPKVYSSSIGIVIDERRSNRNTIDIDALSVTGTTDNLANEMIILKSWDLVERVVDSLNLQTSYYVKSRFKMTEIYPSPFYVRLETPNKKQGGGASFYIEKQGESYKIEGSYWGGGEIKIDETVNHFPQTIHVDGLSFINIRLTGKPIVDGEKYYINIASFDSTVASYVSRLSVARKDKGASVLIISLQNGNPAKGAAVLDELVYLYNQVERNIRNEIAFKKAEFIDDRLSDIAQQLNKAEGNIVSYKEQNRIADLSRETVQAVEKTGGNEQKLMDIGAQLNVVNLVDQFIKNPANKYTVIPNISLSDISLSGIISTYNTKLISSEAFMKGTSEENPTRKRLEEQLNNMREGIVAALNNVKKTYELQQKELLKQSAIAASKVLAVPEQQRGLMEKEREQNIKERLFIFLMQKREETNLAIASSVEKARVIISPVVNIGPIGPRSLKILAQYVVVGFLLPLIIIYLLILFRTKIRNRKELQRLSAVPIIGQIGHNKTKDEIVITAVSTTPIAEMFRSLRNQIKFVFKNENHKIILATSTTSKEGKTFVSANLARAFALMNFRVLLIGADIRNPKLHNYFPNMKSKKGLTDFLLSNEPWTDYIQPSGVDSNLDIMVAGTSIQNPNELLMSPDVKALMDEVKESYDYVIIDSAPVGLVSDTYLIKDFVDISLYITRERQTPKSAIEFANAQYAESKLNNMYIILNDSKASGSYYGYGNYGYGYGSGYGYYNK